MRSAKDLRSAGGVCKIAGVLRGTKQAAHWEIEWSALVSQPIGRGIQGRQTLCGTFQDQGPIALRSPGRGDELTTAGVRVFADVMPLTLAAVHSNVPLRP